MLKGRALLKHSVHDRRSTVLINDQPKVEALKEFPRGIHDDERMLSVAFLSMVKVVNDVSDKLRNIHAQRLHGLERCYNAS